MGEDNTEMQAAKRQVGEAVWATMTSEEKRAAVINASQPAARLHESIGTTAAREAARAYYFSEPLLYEQLQEIFLRVNNTMSITPSEFKKALTGKRKDGFRAVLQTQGKNWNDVFATLDTNHDGAVSCDEFIVAVSTSPDSTGRDIVDSTIVRPTAPTPQEREAYYRSSPYHEDNYYNSHGD